MENMDSSFNHFVPMHSCYRLTKLQFIRSPHRQRNILFTNCAQQCREMNNPINAMIYNNFLQTLKCIHRTNKDERQRQRRWQRKQQQQNQYRQNKSALQILWLALLFTALIHFMYLSNYNTNLVDLP